MHRIHSGILASESTCQRQRTVLVVGEGASKRNRKGVKEEETLQDEGRAEERGQLLFLSYGNGNEVGHGARDNRGPQAG